MKGQREQRVVGSSRAQGAGRRAQGAGLQGFRALCAELSSTSLEI
jgi:hypothetical protein